MKIRFSRILLAALAAIFIGGGFARATTLTGTVNNPDGSPFNGAIFFTLEQATTISSSGTCGGPIYVPNTYRVSVQVVSGSIVSSPNLYDSNCMNPIGIPYNVQLVSSTGQVINQQWIITGTSVNVGTIVPVSSDQPIYSIPLVTKLLAGPGISLSPVGGQGAVTVTAVASLSSVTLEHVFSSAGTYNFSHDLGSLYPLTTAYVKSGSNNFSMSPIDVNTTAVTVPSAADIVITFAAPVSSGGGSGTYSFSVSPTSVTYNPTLGGSQTVNYTITQTVTGGYSGTVNYSVASLAGGMTGVLTPSAITGSGSSTLAVTFPATQAPSTTTFTINATDGTTPSNTTPSLTVSDINQNLLDGWEMREGAGTTFTDATANANNQTFTSGVGSWGAVTGFPGVPFTFNGTGLSTGSNSTLTNFDCSTSFTITWWSKITSAAAYNRFMGDYVPGSYGILLQENPSGGISFDIKGNGGSTAAFDWTTNIVGSLHYFAFVYTGPIASSTESLYIDGVLQSTQHTSSSGSCATGQPWTLGGQATSYIAGTFADVAIYSGAKTGAQIAAYYAAGIK